MFEEPLDYDLISEEPSPLYMGELPRNFAQVPAAVIINLCGAYPTGTPHGLVMFNLPLHDTLDPQMIPSRESLEAFLASVHNHVEKKTSYWHCHAGINRSGLMLASYLHLYRDLRISDAISSLRERRTPMVLCNNIFERLLRTWYGDPTEQEFSGFTLETYMRERQRRRDRILKDR